MERPSNLIIDEKELDKFIDWLPELKPHQAYLVQLMIRSRGLKEKFGFKGTDHVLMFKAVHGYLQATTMNSDKKYWRIRLRHDILRLGLLGAQGEWEYANYYPGRNDIIRYLLSVPWQIIAIYININPANTLKAVEYTINELVGSLHDMARSTGLSSYTKFFRRPDQRYYANLAKSTQTRFHVIDVDNQKLLEEIYWMYEDTFEMKPTLLTTQRGGHIIVDIECLKRFGKEKLYVGSPKHNLIINGVKVSEALSWFKSNVKNVKADRRKLEFYLKVLEEYTRRKYVPFFHRIKMMSEIYMNEDYVPLVELKKQALEPVPGLIYKGEVIVRFFPGDC